MADDKIGTHYEGCEQYHLECARHALADRDRRIEALRELEKDAARLDWLDAQRGDLVDRHQFTGDAELVGHCWGVEGQTYNVRDAIDQAIAASVGESKPSPQVVCAACGKPCGIFSPLCDACRAQVESASGGAQGDGNG